MTRIKLKEDMKKVGIITAKELQDAFPQLYSYYASTLEGRKPPITLYAGTDYSFSAQQDDDLSDYWANTRVAILHQGKILFWDSSKPNPDIKPQRVALQPGDAVLDMSVIRHWSASLYVDQSFINHGAIGNQPANQISPLETYVLLLLDGYVSAARIKALQQPYFSYIKQDVLTFGNNWEWPISPRDYTAEVRKYGKTYAEAYLNICKDLALKGYAKVNAAGSAQITLAGKNFLISSGIRR